MIPISKPDKPLSGRRKVEIEICCTDVASLVIAATAKVDRVELCADITVGGVTPSAGMIDRAVRLGVPSVNVLIRPRGGNFVYSEAEVKVMEADIAVAKSLGATGVVIGALDRDGKFDIAVMKRLCEAAEGMERIVSRAIDVAGSQYEALNTIIELGCERVLTSGGADSAPNGLAGLQRMVHQAAGRVVIMAGGGVRPENVMDLYDVSGISAFHTTAHRSERKDFTDCGEVSGFGSYIDAYSDMGTIYKMVELRDTLNNRQTTK
ncbi:MAG: copper homeostasis protein CutC [Muribaculaceae bacterium]|nr:copper homeostasis protein CutC [Muribaculaceae bacterium]